MAVMNLPRPLTSTTGYGPQNRVPIDGATPPPQSSDPEVTNQWLTAQPWYRAALQAWGMDAARPALTVQQRAQIGDALVRAGAYAANPDLKDYQIDTDGTLHDIHSTAGKVIALSIGGLAVGAALAPALVGSGATTAALGPTSAASMASTDAAVAGATVPGSLAASTGAALGTTAATGATAAETGSLTGAFSSPAALGPTSASSMAATDAAVSGSTVPAALGGTGAMPVVAGAAPAVAGAAPTTTQMLARVLPSAIGNIVGNVIQNRSIDQAQQAQIDASNRALAAQTAAGERAIGILSPWANVGGAAINRLGELLHLPVQSGGPASGGGPSSQIAPGQDSVRAPNGYTVTGMATAPVGPGSSTPAPPPSRQIGTFSAPSAQAGSFTGAMQPITIQDQKTGETRQVPAEQEQHWVSVGGRRIA